jgi:hypothetical protein
VNAYVDAIGFIWVTDRFEKQWNDFIWQMEGVQVGESMMILAQYHHTNIQQHQEPSLGFGEGGNK